MCTVVLWYEGIENEKDRVLDGPRPRDTQRSLQNGVAFAIRPRIELLSDNRVVVMDVLCKVGIGRRDQWSLDSAYQVQRGRSALCRSISTCWLR